jgi:hypothetical protein
VPFLSFLVLSFAGSDGWIVRVRDAFYVVVVVAVVIEGLFLTRAYGWNSKQGRMFGLITIGYASWLMGELIWLYFAWFTDVDLFPSVADYFFLAGYPIFFVGFGAIAMWSKTYWPQKLLLRLLPFYLPFVAATIYFSVFKAYDPSQSWWYNAVSIGYGVGDLILIGFVLITIFHSLEYKGGKLTLPWSLVGYGLISYWLADTLFAMLSEQYEQGGSFTAFNDLVWVVSYFLVWWGFSTMRQIVKGYHGVIKEQLTQQKTTLQ